MDAKLKAKWVAALRSGKYKRGVFKLKAKNEQTGVYHFCCLGVLRDITTDIRAAKGGCYLQEKKSGIDKNTQVKLGNFNDGNTSNGKRWGFKRIATWIEKNL